MWACVCACLAASIVVWHVCQVMECSVTCSFHLQTKLNGFQLKKTKKTEDVVPDNFNIQGAFLVLHFRHTAEGFQ